MKRLFIILSLLTLTCIKVIGQDGNTFDTLKASINETYTFQLYKSDSIDNKLNKADKYLQYFVAVGIGALLVSAFSDDDSSAKKKKNSKKKLFISFAIEDQKYRTFLVGQAKNDRSPFTFTDMSVKAPWEQKEWQRKCRNKIRSCDGMIVLLSKNTWHAGGARWEIKCAKEEKIPVVGMHIKKNDIGAIPPELQGKKIIEWSWSNLEQTINKI